MSSVSSATSSTVSTTAVTGSTDLGQDTFLRLLTTQMQNQDPLSPMSNEEFVAQLAQFSSLEQLQGISAGIESLALLNNSMNNSQMVNLLGQKVVAMGDTVNYDGQGDLPLHYDASSATQQTTVTITDADGTVVWSGDIGPAEGGENVWTWDGRTSSGAQAPAGEYTFSFEGTSSDGGEVAVAELIVGVVDEMDYSTGTPTPSIDGTSFGVGDILRVEAQEAS